MWVQTRVYVEKEWKKKIKYIGYNIIIKDFLIDK